MSNHPGVGMCPFCPATPALNEMRTHLANHLVVRILCNKCEKTIAESRKPCPEHYGQTVTPTATEMVSIKKWMNTYRSKINNLTSFDFCPGCSICSTLKMAGFTFRDVDGDDDYLSHIQSHLEYYPTDAHNSSLIFNDEKIPYRLNKLDDFLTQSVAEYEKRRHGESVTGPSSDNEVLDDDSKSISGDIPEHKENTHSDAVKGSPASEKETCHSESASPDVASDQIEVSQPNVNPKPAERIWGPGEQEAISRLRFLKISLEKLEDVSKYKVISDPHAFLSEVPETRYGTGDDEDDAGGKRSKKKAKPNVINPYRDVRTVLSEYELDIPQELPDVACSDENYYFCLFCHKKKDDIKLMEIDFEHHYYEHLDYFPLKCGVCSEVITTERKMLQHIKSSHATETKVKITKEYQESTENWVRTFLDAQKKGVGLTKKGVVMANRKICPVCILTLEKESLDKLPSDRQGVLAHVCLHLHYNSYSCIKCEAAGTSFRTALVNYKAYDHIVKKHPSDSNTPLELIFKRCMAVKSLDKYIHAYLKSHYVSVMFSMPMFLPKGYVEKMAENEIKLKQKEIEKQRMIREKERKNRKKIKKAERKKQLELMTKNYSKILPKPMAGSMLLPNVQNSSQLNTSSLQYLLQNSVVQQQPSRSQMMPHPGPVPNSLLAYAPALLKPQFAVRYTQELDPSLFDTTLSEEAKKVLPEFPYFCVFCDSNDLQSKDKAICHYSRHLDYLPVVCLLCSKRFASIASLKTHHKEIHEKNLPGCDMLFILNEKPEIEEWIDKFLMYQRSAKAWNDIPNPFMKNCLVCQNLIRDKNHYPKNQSAEISMDHINTHLNYYPYECRLCKSSGRRGVRMPSTETQARNHLKNVHGLELEAEKVTRLFSKILSIHQLEEAIDEYLVLNQYGKKAKKFNENAADAEKREPFENDAPIPEKSYKPWIPTDEKMTKTSICCGNCHSHVTSHKWLKRHHYSIHPDLSIFFYSPGDLTR